MRDSHTGQGGMPFRQALADARNEIQKPVFPESDMPNPVGNRSFIKGNKMLGWTFGIVSDNVAVNPHNCNIVAIVRVLLLFPPLAVLKACKSFTMIALHGNHALQIPRVIFCTFREPFVQLGRRHPSP